MCIGSLSATIVTGAKASHYSGQLCQWDTRYSALQRGKIEV